MAKLNQFSYGHLPLYLYLIGAYAKFLTVGKCLDFPLVLQVQTQSFCNGRCSICPYPIVSKRLDQGTMEWNLFEKIATEAASEPLLRVFVFELQNEPLLDKRILDCVKYLKSMSPNKYSLIITNGELLDKFSSADIVQSNLDTVAISINAHSKETYKKINSGLDYDKVMENVSCLLSNQSTRHKVRLNFIPTEQNMREVHEATQYWKRQGVNVKVFGLTNRAGSVNGYEQMRPKTEYLGYHLLSRVWRRLMTKARRVIGCHLPFYQMSILFNGDVIICEEDWNRVTVVGNIRDSSLKEIWNSRKMNEIRRLILRKRYQQLDTCKECSHVKFNIDAR